MAQLGFKGPKACNGLTVLSIQGLIGLPDALRGVEERGGGARVANRLAGTVTAMDALQLMSIANAVDVPHVSVSSATTELDLDSPVFLLRIRVSRVSGEFVAR